MINLLPPETKKEINQEENWKLIMILEIVILFFLISLFLILFSIKIYVSGEINVQKILYDQREDEFKNSQMRPLEEEIDISNKILSELDNFYKNQMSFAETLEIISKTIPSGSYLTNLSAVPQQNTINFGLSGFSPTRENLLKFKENLEKEEFFKEIYFPPINWAQSTNINFSVNFKKVK